MIANNNHQPNFKKPLTIEKLGVPCTRRSHRARKDPSRQKKLKKNALQAAYALPTKHFRLAAQG